MLFRYCSYRLKYVDNSPNYWKRLAMSFSICQYRKLLQFCKRKAVRKFLLLSLLTEKKKSRQHCVSGRAVVHFTTLTTVRLEFWGFQDSELPSLTFLLKQKNRPYTFQIFTTCKWINLPNLFFPHEKQND